MANLYTFGNQTGTPGQPAIVEIAGPLSGFGEVETVFPTPTSQAAFVYGVQPLLVETLAYSTGAAVATAAGEVVVSSGTDAASYARVTGRQVTKYRAGQGTLGRWTARFSAGVAGNRQTAGLSNQEAGYLVGYNGDTFGLFYVRSGTIEIQTLTVTGAPAAPGNVSITLAGGPAVSVAVTASGSTAVTAYEISRANYSQASGGWIAAAVGSVVYFRRRLVGPAAASTFAPGATGTAAAFAILTPGVAAVEFFTPRSAWNGTVPTGFDPTRGNVYGIQFQYLGYGDAFLYIEDGTTGRLVLAHTVANANTLTGGTVLRNPNLYLLWESRNVGGVSSVQVAGASGGTFIEGVLGPTGTQFATTGSKTAGAGVETPILTLRAGLVFLGRASMGQIQVDRISVATDGTKSVRIRAYKGSTLTAARFQAVNAAVSVAESDTAATVFAAAPGVEVFAFTVGKVANASENLLGLGIFLQAGEYLTITATSVNASDVDVALAWIEDV